jgi:hypothetical protein
MKLNPKKFFNISPGSGFYIPFNNGQRYLAPVGNCLGVFDAKTHRNIALFAGHPNEIRCAAIFTLPATETGSCEILAAVTGCLANEFRIWNISTGDCLYVIPSMYPKSYSTLCYAIRFCCVIESRLLAEAGLPIYPLIVCGVEGELIVWNTQKNQLLCASDIACSLSSSDTVRFPRLNVTCCTVAKVSYSDTHVLSLIWGDKEGQINICSIAHLLMQVDSLKEVEQSQIINRIPSEMTMPLPPHGLIARCKINKRPLVSCAVGTVCLDGMREQVIIYGTESSNTIEKAEVGRYCLRTGSIVQRSTNMLSIKQCLVVTESAYTSKIPIFHYNPIIIGGMLSNSRSGSIEFWHSQSMSLLETYSVGYTPAPVMNITVAPYIPRGHDTPLAALIYGCHRGEVYTYFSLKSHEKIPFSREMIPISELGLLEKAVIWIAEKKVLLSVVQCGVRLRFIDDLTDTCIVSITITELSFNNVQRCLPVNLERINGCKLSLVIITLVSKVIIVDLQSGFFQAVTAPSELSVEIMKAGGREYRLLLGGHYGYKELLLLLEDQGFRLLPLEQQHYCYPFDATESQVCFATTQFTSMRKGRLSILPAMITNRQEADEPGRLITSNSVVAYLPIQLVQIDALNKHLSPHLLCLFSTSMTEHPAPLRCCWIIESEGVPVIITACAYKLVVWYLHQVNEIEETSEGLIIFQRNKPFKPVILETMDLMSRPICFKFNEDQQCLQLHLEGGAVVKLKSQPYISLASNHPSKWSTYQRGGHPVNPLKPTTIITAYTVAKKLQLPFSLVIECNE